MLNEGSPITSDETSRKSTTRGFSSLSASATDLLRRFAPIQRRGGQDAHDPLIGQLLADRYLILDKLGEGDMAVVYRARHNIMDRIVAIKTLKLIDEELMQRFAREVSAHAKLKHKNIVEAIDWLQSAKGQPFFIMEYLEGISLEDLLDEHGRIEREQEIATIALQVCDALEHAHAMKVIHRDLKPGNIVLLCKDGEITAKVVDFGLVKLQEDMQRLTREGQALGSPLYMSPEQCMGLPITSRTDIYSLAIIMFEMVTGQTPYEADSIMEIMAAHCEPHIQPEKISNLRSNLKGSDVLQEVLSKALEKNANDRYQTVDEFRDDIRKWERTFKKEPPKTSVGTVPAIKAVSKLTVPAYVDEEADQKKSIVAVVALTQNKVADANLELLATTKTGMTKDAFKPPPKALSPEQMVIALVAFCVFGSILAAGAAGLIIMNMDAIQKLWVDASINVSNVTTPKGAQQSPKGKVSKKNRFKNLPKPQPMDPKTGESPILEIR